MVFVALGGLLLALLIRGPRSLLGLGRMGMVLLSLVAGAGALYAGLRGSWLGASLLLTGALWLAADARGRAAPPASSMSMAEARATLGVAEGASRPEIEAAYRRLIQRVHPDVGGAPGLAAQLNRARDTLLAAG